MEETDNVRRFGVDVTLKGPKTKTVKDSMLSRQAYVVYGWEPENNIKVRAATHWTKEKGEPQFSTGNHLVSHKRHGINAQH